MVPKHSLARPGWACRGHVKGRRWWLTGIALWCQGSSPSPQPRACLPLAPSPCWHGVSDGLLTAPRTPPWRCSRPPAASCFPDRLTRHAPRGALRALPGPPASQPGTLGFPQLRGPLGLSTRRLSCVLVAPLAHMLFPARPGNGDAGSSPPDGADALRKHQRGILRGILRRHSEEAASGWPGVICSHPHPPVDGSVRGRKAVPEP